MAINRLRQQQLFDNYGMMDYMGNMGNMFEPQQAPSPLQPAFGMPPEQPTTSPLDPVFQAPQLQQIGASPPPPPPSNQPSMDWIDKVNQLYTPETRASDRYNDLLDAAPERGDPGIARRIAASAAALNTGEGGGIEAAEKFMYAPHYRNMQDWTAKTQPFGQASQQENVANANERQLTGQMVQAQQNQQKIDETNRANIAREEGIRNSQRLREMAQQGWKFNFDGPYVMAYNATDPTPKNTGVRTENLGEMDRLQIQYMMQASMQGLRAADQRALQDDRQQNEAIMQDDRQAGQIALKQTPGAGTTDPGDYNKMRGDVFLRAIDRDPSIAKWFTPPATANGTWDMKPPDASDYWFTGKGSNYEKDVADFNRARVAVGLPPMGGQSTGSSSQTPPAPPSGTSPTPPAAPRVGGTNPRDPNYGKNVPATPVLPQGNSGNTNPRSALPPTGGETVRVKNLETGQTGNMPVANVAAAVASGKYQVIQ
jgi:hypothetical protein